MIKLYKNLKQKEDEKGRDTVGKFLWEIGKSLIALQDFIEWSDTPTDSDREEINGVVESFEMMEQHWGYGKF